MRSEQNKQDPMGWHRRESFIASDGYFRIRPTGWDSVNLFRIEADGYQPAVSRDIQSNEGAIAIDFDLNPGQNVDAKVVTPRNLPAAGAKVALGLAGEQIVVENGEIDEKQTLCARGTTDEAGRFHFPPQDKEFELVITHPSGYAHIKSTSDWQLTRIIHLEPWSRVEGTFRIGKAPAPNVPIEIDVDVARLMASRNHLPRIFSHHQSSSGPDGRFVFERVIPGRGRIGRHVFPTLDEGAREAGSWSQFAASFPAGQTVHIDLGGTGRAVLGKLQPPAGFSGAVRWNFVRILAGAPEQEQRADRPSITATVDRDGKFRMDDVRAGQYLLRVWCIGGDDPGHLDSHPFVVPPPHEGEPDKPVDLGTLKLQKP